jgi:hypothetical protein
VLGREKSVKGVFFEGFDLSKLESLGGRALSDIVKRRSLRVLHVKKFDGLNQGDLNQGSSRNASAHAWRALSKRSQHDWLCKKRIVSDARCPG